MSDKPRALFFGTPEFAVPCLSALAELCDVQLVITQPDRPAGRGMKLAPPPVKLRAQELGLSVIQPSKVRTPEFAAQLRAAQAELALVVAYGRILPAAVLSAASFALRAIPHLRRSMSVSVGSPRAAEQLK